MSARIIKTIIVLIKLQRAVRRQVVIGGFTQQYGTKQWFISHFFTTTIGELNHLWEVYLLRKKTSVKLKYLKLTFIDYSTLRLGHPK